MVELYQTRDNEKKILCEQSGIHFVVVPYWWDLTWQSLCGTIQKLRGKFLDHMPTYSAIELEIPIKNHK
jgi:hypothetical protein